MSDINGSIDRVSESISPKNKQTIRDMYDFLVSKHKQNFLYKKILEIHKAGAIALNQGDLDYIGNLLGYKREWAKKKAKELGLKSVASTYRFD